MRVKQGTREEMDRAVRTLFAAHLARQNPADERFEVERMPADNPAPVSRVKRTPKVSAPIPAEMPVADVTDTPKAIRGDRARYAEGFYREPCRKCGEGIPRTGARGRAPVYHPHCRPQG